MLKKAFFYTLLLACMLFIWAPGTPPQKPSDAQLTVKTGNHEVVLSVELALTYEQQASGLMHRTQLGDHEGMLFVFGTPRNISMWMKDTPLSLDMFFIDEHGIVVHIAENTVPMSTDHIVSPYMVKAVLEMKAGMARKHGITLGSRLTGDYFKP